MGKRVSSAKKFFSGCQEKFTFFGKKTKARDMKQGKDIVEQDIERADIHFSRILKGQDRIQWALMLVQAKDHSVCSARRKRRHESSVCPLWRSRSHYKCCGLRKFI